MKNEGFDQLAYARRIRSAGRAIHIPQDDGEVRNIPSDALRVYQTGGIIESTALTGVPALVSQSILSSLRRFRCSLFPISSLNFRGSRPLVRWLEDPEVIDGPSRATASLATRLSSSRGTSSLTIA